MSLQYLETLKQIGASPASKIVVPMELSGLVAGDGGAHRAGEGQRRSGRLTAGPSSGPGSLDPNVTSGDRGTPATSAV